jgi:hypothetical protein
VSSSAGAQNAPRLSSARRRFFLEKHQGKSPAIRLGTERRGRLCCNTGDVFSSPATELADSIQSFVGTVAGVVAMELSLMIF